MAIGIPPKTLDKAHSMMDELIQENEIQQDTSTNFMNMPVLEALTKPFTSTWVTENLLMPVFGGLTKKLGLMTEPTVEKTPPLLDFTGSKDLNKQDIDQSWNNLSIYGQNPKWKGKEGSRIIHLPLTEDAYEDYGTHAELPIDSYFEFLKLVDWYGLPNKKGKFGKPQTIMRNK